MQTKLGRLIYRLQAEKNLSNLELAQKMGMVPQDVAKIKTRKRLHAKTLHRLATALGEPVNIFLKVIR